MVCTNNISNDTDSCTFSSTDRPHYLCIRLIGNIVINNEKYLQWNFYLIPDNIDKPLYILDIINKYSEQVMLFVFTAHGYSIPFIKNSYSSLCYPTRQKNLSLNVTCNCIKILEWSKAFQHSCLSAIQFVKFVIYFIVNISLRRARPILKYINTNIESNWIHFLLEYFYEVYIYSKYINYSKLYV